MTLEQQIDKVWDVRAPSGIYDSCVEWSQRAAHDDHKYVDTYKGIEAQRIKSTIKLISNNMTLALISPSAYIREYVTIIQRDSNDS